jgi:hypothetical protein
MRDPVTPYLARPAKIGWKAKRRQIDLTIDRPFNGDELLLRMKGWITVPPREIIDLIRAGQGTLKVLEDGGLGVETDTSEAMAEINEELKERFRDQVDLDPI